MKSVPLYPILKKQLLCILFLLFCIKNRSKEDPFRISIVKENPRRGNKGRRRPYKVLFEKLRRRRHLCTKEEAELQHSSLGRSNRFES